MKRFFRSEMTVLILVILSITCAANDLDSCEPALVVWQVDYPSDCSGLEQYSILDLVGLTNGTCECNFPIHSDAIAGRLFLIPKGTTMQGSPLEEDCRFSQEGPQFNHSHSRDVVVMQTEVTRQMWADLKSLQTSLSLDPSDITVSPNMDHPVQRNTWYEAVFFANLLSLQSGFSRCYYKDTEFTLPVNSTNYWTMPIYCNFDASGFRLPTEGEWERLARVGTIGPFSLDEPAYDATVCNSASCDALTLPSLELFAVFCANELGGPAAVGSKLPNPWGLRDVHGNVREWCWDFFLTNYPTDQWDYTGPENGSQKVNRGGGWNGWASGCRSASRMANFPYDRYNNLGFRLVKFRQ